MQQHIMQREASSIIIVERLLGQRIELLVSTFRLADYEQLVFTIRSSRDSARAGIVELGGDMRIDPKSIVDAAMVAIALAALISAVIV